MLTLNGDHDIYAAANADEFNQAAKPMIYEIVDALKETSSHIRELSGHAAAPGDPHALNQVVHHELRPAARQIKDLTDAMAYHQPAKAAEINELRRICDELKTCIEAAIAAEAGSGRPDYRRRILKLAGRTGSLAQSARMLGHKMPGPYHAA